MARAVRKIILNMRFKVVVGEQIYAVDVAEALLQDAGEFHAKLDSDMDRGWQMSRFFVKNSTYPIFFKQL